MKKDTFINMSDTKFVFCETYETLSEAIIEAKKLSNDLNMTITTLKAVNVERQNIGINTYDDACDVLNLEIIDAASDSLNIAPIDDSQTTLSYPEKSIN